MTDKVATVKDLVGASAEMPVKLSVIDSAKKVIEAQRKIIREEEKKARLKKAKALNSFGLKVADLVEKNQVTDPVILKLYAGFKK